MTKELFDVIILGAGPAGLSAGIYASRGKLKTLILNEGAIGGQVTLTHEIANYPGVETIPGYELVSIMKNQAKSFGCKIKSNLKITNYELQGEMKRITVNDKDVYETRTVILAAGGTSRMLNIPGEIRFKGSGVSYCATCDGDFFTDKELIVVGGGNSALEEAVSLTKYASKITIIHQFDHFQAFEHAIEEARSNPKINFIMSSELREIKGNETVESVIIENLETKQLSVINTDGVFVFIGYIPNTESFNGIVALNERSEIITDQYLQTNLKGVFAAGDAIAKRFRQVTTAVADGTTAALMAAEYIHKTKKIEKNELVETV